MAPQSVGQSSQRRAVPNRRRSRGRPQRGQLKPISVDDIVADDVVTAEPDTPIRTVVAKFAEDDVGSVVVVDDGQPIGIITDRKVALALEETPDIVDHNAEKLVDGDVVAADPSTNMFDALQLMSDEGIRRLPTVDENGTLQGIVTLDDALVLLSSELGNVAETVKAQSPRL